MKLIIQRVLLLSVLLLPILSPAQTYQDIYGFSLYSGFPGANSDGALPYCALALSGNTLYGTTYEGGTNGTGAIFSVRTDGSSFTNLHSFSALSASFYGDNSDGAQPYDTLLLSSNMLYGTASIGGTAGFGTLFRIKTDGSSFTNLHNFTDGAGTPRAELILSSNVLYGTTDSGGNGYGSVFRINTDGTDFTNLHSFTTFTNDAFAPAGGLAISGSSLYGTAESGGLLGGGVVFTVSTGGKGYTNLFNFQGHVGQGQISTNNTGGQPYASLLLISNRLYGTTLDGGTNGNGVLFAINTSGTGFTNLHTFAAASSGSTNADGASPGCKLLLIGSSLYGTAPNSGLNGYGTVLAINTNGSNFRVVYQFVDIPGVGYLDTGGASPFGGLIFTNGTVYGTTLEGGGYDGNVYSLNLSIPLSSQSIGGNLVLHWSDPSFSIQASPTLTGPFTNVPNATSPFTNTPAAGQQFFRLVAN